MVRTTRAGDGEAGAKRARLARGVAWAVAPLALIVAVVVLGLRGRPHAASAPAVAAIPEGAALLVTVDVVRARSSDLSSLLATQAAALGACAHDPLAVATTLAIGMPRGEGDEFGVAVAGPFVASELSACARQAIETRRGWVTTTDESGFRVVADATAHGAGVVAVRDGGPLLFGGASYVRAMIATATGGAPSIENDPRHRDLRAAVDASATLVGSLLRPENAEGMRAIAGSAATGARVEVRAYAECDRAETCAGLARLAKNAQDELGPLAKLTWMGAAAARATVEPKGATLRARVDLSSSEAREAFTLLLGR